LTQVNRRAPRAAVCLQCLMTLPLTIRRALRGSVAAMVFATWVTAAAPRLPLTPGELRQSITHAEMLAFLESLPRSAGKLELSVQELTRSPEGRTIPLVHLRRPGARNPLRVLLVAQQHGDEVSGKDALLFLLRDFAAAPDSFPSDLELWLVPMLNPDGAEGGRRNNGAGVDLNRDHLLLSQPETRALHALARRLHPHLSVDCHEFTRDSRDYLQRGWGEWPLIMMDTANHPLLPAQVYETGLKWVEEAEVAMAGLGIAYQRYLVGDAPRQGELRPSTLDADDARNSLALHGGLSFIIEAGVKRRAADPDADLGERVSAYLHLLRWLLAPDPQRRAQLAAMEAARGAPLPGWLPSNVFWANSGVRETLVPVVELASGRTVKIPTATVMHDRIVKTAQPTPWGYAIAADAASVFRPLLEAHGITFESVTAARTVVTSRCRLLRLEEEYDEVYHRYEGRQIVACAEPQPRTLRAGTLLVALDQPTARTVAAVLEPRMLYGLYQYPPFRALVGQQGALPVDLVLAPEVAP